MKVIIFTGPARIEDSPWWAVITSCPEISQVLVLSHAPRRHPWTSLRKNIAKHGLVFLPYRVTVLLVDLMKPLVRGRRGEIPTGPRPATLIRPDLHAVEVLEEVRRWQPDLGISLGAPILRQSLFQIPVRGTINLHLGQLPGYRGAPPAFWELTEDASSIGANVHRMDTGLDTGNIISSAMAPIYPDDTLERVTFRAEELGRIVLREAVARVGAGDFTGVPQPSGGRTHRAPTLSQRARLALRLRFRALVRTCQPRQLAKRASYLGLMCLYRPGRDAWRTVRGNHPVRVFTYHRVSHLCRDGMTITPDAFEAQCRYIRRTHLVLSLAAALQLLTRQTPRRRPVAVLTFDDGYQSVFDFGLPVLRRLGMGATCFVSTDLLSTNQRFAHDEGNAVYPLLRVMTWAQVEELAREGWQIGGHTASHRRLSRCTVPQLEYELGQPLAELRDRLSLDRPAMSYPFGEWGDITTQALQMAQSAGYSACCSNFGGENISSADPMSCLRIDLGGAHPAFAWQAWIHGFAFAAPKGGTLGAEIDLAAVPMAGQ